MNEREELNRLRKLKRLRELEAREKLSQPREEAATADDLMRSFDSELGTQAAPSPQQGNIVSRAIGNIADTRALPGAPGAIISGVAGAAEGIAEAPIQSLVEPIVTAPRRALTGIANTGPALAEGDFRGAFDSGVEGLTAAGELALTFAAPGAGSVARQGASKAAAPLAKPTGRALKSLQEADPQLLQSAQRAQRLQAEGVPATTADLTTRNAQSRLKGAARRDGPAQDLAQDALDPRQADQSSRLTRTIEDAFGVEGDFLGKIDSIKTAKAEAAKPLYDEAYSTPTQLTPKLTELVKRPPLQKAMREAEELASIDGVRLNAISDGSLPVVKVRNANGSTKLQGDTGRLHYMRKALDDQIDAYRDKTTGKLSGAPRAQALVRLRRQFNEAIREANPSFAKADAIWSEGTAVEQAMERGLKASSMRTERQVRQLMDDAIREGDQEFFELGFAQGLVEKVGAGGSDMANRTLKLLSPENQKITRTVLGKERGDALLNRLRVENLMTRTRNKISPNVGSDTAENAQQTAATAISLFADLASGNIARLGAQGLRMAGQKKLSEQMIKTQREVDEQLIRLATEDPEELIRLIQQAQQAKPRGQIALPDLTKPSVAVTGSGLAESAAREANQLALPRPIEQTHP